jgi:NAD(P)-dependent dehydrogenase (short-subunit alcohol dehydrogenase family)
MDDVTQLPLPAAGLGLGGCAVLITGGASGIGRATAQYLVEAGARVVLTDTDEAMLEDAVGALAPSEGLATVAADTTDETGMDAAVAGTVERFGRLDGLVACAGIRQVATPALDFSWEVWSRILEVNLRGALVAARAAARVMIEQEAGSIVAVASVAGAVPRIGQVAYGASKAAVIQVTRVLALELARHRVRVNAVAPGTTRTPLIEQAIRDEGEELLRQRIKGDLEKFRGGVPLGRLAFPEDQAGPIAFLLSPLARFITGQVLFVDGGESMI